MDRLHELTVESLRQQSFDASDPAAVAEAKKREVEAEQDERRSVFNLMQSREGRRFMWGSVSCAFFGNPVVPGDSLGTYYNLGQESRARHLMRELLKISAHQFTLMVKENAGEEFAGKDMIAAPDLMSPDSFI